MNNKNAAVPYSNVRAGALFRVCVDDEHSALVKQGSRLRPDTSSANHNKVKTEGIFVKIADSHSVRASGAHKDAIFLPGTLCRVIRSDVDTSHLPDWAVVNHGRPHQ